MLNHNHQNSECDFAADLVSYLYGEISQKEKLRFESHLAKCGVCPIELAEFADVQSAFGEWRHEFEQLPTPVITVPYETTAPMQIKTFDAADSWLVRLRSVFSLSPVRSAATAALAIFVVCGGLFLLATKISQPENIAQNEIPSKSKVFASPTIDLNTNSVAEKNSAAISPANEFSARQATEKSPEFSVSEKAAFGESEASAKTIPTKSVVKFGGAPKNVKHSSKTKTFSGKVKTFDKTFSTDSPAPRLNNYEEIEDETPRLADLFAEVDTKD